MNNIEHLSNELAKYRQRVIELEQSEAILKMAANSIQLGTWDYYPITGYLNWSDECRDIYGVAPDQKINFSAFADHIYTADRKLVERAIQDAMDPLGNNTYDISYRITRFDNNTIRWIRAQGKVYFNSGRVERFLGTVVDITETKTALDKMSKSEKLFKSIALNLPNSLIIVIDTDHRFITIEGDLMVKLGYDSKNYEGKHPTEVAPPERYEATKHLYDRVLAGEKFSTERKSETGDDFMVHFVPLKNADDEIYAGLIIAMDITDIKHAEERSAKLAAIVESSDDAIISKNFESIITSWNKSAERIFGYTEQEMVGESILKLIPPDRHDEEPRILATLRSGNRVDHFETKRMTKSGELLDLSLTISPIKDNQGKIIGLSKIARDITERKQEEVRKNDFIAMVSHELKTPLTSIRSYIQVLLAKAKQEDDTFKINALARADVQTRKMTSMIQDFLNLARLEDGKIILSCEVFELNPLVEEIVGDMQLLSTGHNIHYEGCGGITVYADKDKIGQVLINLLSNAVKYSPKGGDIIIGCEKAWSGIKLFVKDNGIGINAEDQKMLFNRFYRVKNDKMKTVSGFGIGLYLVAELLRYHNSEIKVESEEGKGSLFYFILPAK